MAKHHFGEWKEPVSIIGVGCTPFGDLLTTPELKGMTERELFAWAALEAIEDAGIETKDVDAFYVGHCGAESISRNGTTASVVADWIGARHKPIYHHEAASATSLCGLHHAVLAVASGAYRIVLTGGLEVARNTPVDGKLAHVREPVEIARKRSGQTGGGSNDLAYWAPSGMEFGGLIDANALLYGKKYGVSWEQLEDTMDAVAIIDRENGVKNSLATFYKKTYDEEAKEHGFSDAKQYLRSLDKIGAISRTCHFLTPADGAAAQIVCPTKIAKTLKEHFVDVIGIGGGNDKHFREAVIPLEDERIAYERAYAMANIDPHKDVDFLYVHDCYASRVFVEAEAAGYFRPGEAWRAILEGRTAIGGDKPLSTTGGRLTMGHAFAASGGAEIAEAVRQMRGTCGPRQIKPFPEVAVQHIVGSGNNVQVIVLRAHA